jgi:hypothetical protein
VCKFMDGGPHRPKLIFLASLNNFYQEGLKNFIHWNLLHLKY